jgi:hypothetical protein
MALDTGGSDPCIALENDLSVTRFSPSLLFLFLVYAQAEKGKSLQSETIILVGMLTLSKQDILRLNGGDICEADVASKRAFAALVNGLNKQAASGSGFLSMLINIIDREALRMSTRRGTRCVYYIELIGLNSPLPERRSWLF